MVLKRPFRRGWGLSIQLEAERLSRAVHAKGNPEWEWEGRLS